MISGTTRAVSSIPDSSKLIDKKVPQHKAMAAGSRSQQTQLKRCVTGKFTSDNMKGK